MSTEIKLTPVEYIFKTMAAVYGAAWERSMGQAPLADVMTAWEYHMQPFTQSQATKKMIVWALDNLPDRVPNVLEFKALCRRTPALETPMLPEPVADPARMKSELAKLGHVKISDKPAHGMKDWAYRLKTRHENGERLNGNQIRCYRLALGEAK